jgi:type II secretory pathway component GspD/PulD (secretin)
MTMKWIAMGITALGLAALPAARPVAAPLGPQAGGGAKAGAVLEFDAEDKGLEIADLIAQAKSVTGEEFFFDPKDVRDARVTFSGKMSVPREKFLSFFDWCLHEADFVDCERVVAGLRVHSLRKLSGQGGGGGRSNQALKTGARVVERAELDVIADRFTLVTTTYSCKNLPAREAVTTLQLYFADSATEAVRNIEGTDSIVMTGLAPNLAAICAMLDRMDAHVGTSEEFLRTKALTEKVSALETQVAALVKRAKDEDALMGGDDNGK